MNKRIDSLTVRREVINKACVLDAAKAEIHNAKVKLGIVKDRIKHGRWPNFTKQEKKRMLRDAYRHLSLSQRAFSGLRERIQKFSKHYEL